MNISSRTVPSAARQSIVYSLSYFANLFNEPLGV